MKRLPPILRNKALRMGEDKRRKKPLADRIKERLRDLVDDLVGTLEGLVVPQPEPIPIRKRYR
jgi:hypothetical protein